MSKCCLMKELPAMSAVIASSAVVVVATTVVVVAATAVISAIAPMVVVIVVGKRVAEHASSGHTGDCDSGIDGLHWAAVLVVGCHAAHASSGDHNEG